MLTRISRSASKYSTHPHQRLWYFRDLICAPTSQAKQDYTKSEDQAVEDMLEMDASDSEMGTPEDHNEDPEEASAVEVLTDLAQQKEIVLAIQDMDEKEEDDLGFGNLDGSADNAGEGKAGSLPDHPDLPVVAPPPKYEDASPSEEQTSRFEEAFKLAI